MDQDVTTAIEAARSQGFVSEAMLTDRLGWTPLRARACLGTAVDDGVAMIDDGDPSGTRLFWFPALNVSLQNASVQG